MCVQVVKDWVESKLNSELQLTNSALEEIKSHFNLEVYTVMNKRYMYSTMQVQLHVLHISFGVLFYLFHITNLYNDKVCPL